MKLNILLVLLISSAMVQGRSGVKIDLLKGERYGQESSKKPGANHLN